ncbi:MAG: LLM class flavin-dependent oxidoreductase [Actinomycetota bacterium]|nr:MAG: LLM class flavin-dependent oxidoreductase [Actinomycetota bacterium]
MAASVGAVRHALFLAPFDQLADPHALVDVAAAAEEAGWDGVFLWDHVLRPPDESQDIADAWIALAAMACATTRIRLGTMVTPLVRRRVQVLARQTVTLDHLSKGRLVLGIGLGVDGGRELSAFGEETDPRRRGEHTDEAVVALHGLWSGERTTVHGRDVWVDGVTFLPRPVQRPRIPTWFAARGDALRPARRAGRHGDGLFPIEVDRSRLARMLDAVAAERGSLEGFDVAVRLSDGPSAFVDLRVTWVLHDFPPDVELAAVHSHITRAERS